MKKVVIKSKQRVFDDFFKIDEVYLQRERFDGQMSRPFRQLVFERGDSVAAIVFNKKTEQLILIKQFRYATYEKGPGWIIEAVAGVLEPEESPEEAIRREILEEIGYQVGHVTHISTFYVSPGGTSERIMLYYAEVSQADKVATGGGLTESHEDIKILTYSLPEIWELLKTGQIVDAKTLIGLMWLQSQLKG